MILGVLLGGAAGYLIGSLLDAGEDDEHQQLDVELTYRDDEDGRHFVLKPSFTVSDNTWYALTLADPPSDVRVHADFADTEGNFIMAADVIGPAGEAICFVPWGAIDARGGARVVLRVATLDDEQLLGFTTFEEDLWPSRGGYSQPRHWRPLIQLARAVAEPFGDECLKAADTAVRDWIEVVPHEDAAFRIAWRSSRGADVDDAVDEFLARFPYIDEVDVFSHLAGLVPVGTSIGTPVMRRIAKAMGLSKNDWPGDPRVSETGGPSDGPKQGPSKALRTGLDEVPSAYARLGVSVGASLDDVRSAYRSLMKDYHPDRVAGLPAEFQELAKIKSQEINAAHRTVLHHLRDQSAA